jgi:hypothetical protein
MQNVTTCRSSILLYDACLSVVCSPWKCDECGRQATTILSPMNCPQASRWCARCVARLYCGLEQQDVTDRLFPCLRCSLYTGTSQSHQLAFCRTPLYTPFTRVYRTHTAFRVSEAQLTPLLALEHHFSDTLAPMCMEKICCPYCHSYGMLFHYNVCHFTRCQFDIWLDDWNIN